MQHQTDISIVGAGPAGLSAAIAAARSGCRVTLLDAYSRPGGQYYRQLAPGLKSARPGRLHHAYEVAAGLFEQVAADSRIEVLSQASVWAAERAPHGFVLQVEQITNPARPAFELLARKVVLAPGAYDRALAFPGWDLPGVMTAGGIQSLLKSFRVLPGQRVALSGSGPFLLPVAALLAESGAEVVGVFEASHPRYWLRQAGPGWRYLDKLAEGAGYLAVLRKYRVPYRFGRAVIRAEGDGRLERVHLARLEPDWQPRAGQTPEVLEVDALGVGYGFTPSTELSYALGCDHYYEPDQAAMLARHDRDMQSSQPGIYVAGEITGIGGAAVALRQGRLAGWACAASLGQISAAEAEQRSAATRQELARHTRFAGLLNRLFALQPGRHAWLTPETIICRCEEVSAGAVEQAVRQSRAQDARGVKLLTRCGMGLCQGRMCGHLVTGLVAHYSGRPPGEVGALATRPLVRPVPLAYLATQTDNEDGET